MEGLRCYLLDGDSGFIDLEAGRAFNLIDVVFINGDASAQPWSENNKEVALIIKFFFLDLCFGQNVYESE